MSDRGSLDFVGGLLGEWGYKVSRGIGYDFNAEKADLKLAIEVKSQDLSKPTGKLVIDWSQIEALMRAAKNGRTSYLFLHTKDKQYCAIFGLVDCWGVSHVGEQPSESPFVSTAHL